MLVNLMQQAMNEKRVLTITDGYNNLYRLVPKNGNCFMYEHSATIPLEIPVEVSFDILNNNFYSEV